MQRMRFAICSAVLLLLLCVAGCGKRDDVTVELVVPKGYAGHLVLREVPSAPPLLCLGEDRYQITFDAKGSASCREYVNGWHKQVARWSDGTPLAINAPEGVALHDMSSIVNERGDRGVIWWVGTYEHLERARKEEVDAFDERLGRNAKSPATRR